MAVIRALGPAVHHVHLKDTEIVPDQVAIAGVLDQRPFDDPANRAWVFRTAGSVHGHEFWSAFVAALREVGYDDVLAIENEDAGLPARSGGPRGRAASCVQCWRAWPTGRRWAVDGGWRRTPSGGGSVRRSAGATGGRAAPGDRTRRSTPLRPGSATPPSP